MLGARRGVGPFTFAVVGRNEARTLAGVVAEAQQAAGPDDRVWYVDSASADDSVAIARRLSVEVILGPAGKGRAMAAALAKCTEGYVCFVDADLFEWTVNIPATLRAAALSTGADMIVGSFTDDRRRVVMPSIYWPLVDALFPDYGRCCDPVPLSGLRVIDASLPIGSLPPGYGAETYLNLAVAAGGHRIAIADLGFVRGPLRRYANVEECALAVTAAILDFAEVNGRLAPQVRPAWEQWVHDVLKVIAIPPPVGSPDREFQAALDAVVARPLPQPHAGTAAPRYD